METPRAPSPQHVAAVRSALAAGNRHWSDDDVEERVAASLASLLPSEADDFWRSVGTFVQNAAPGAIQGAATGAAAGPWGALLGGIAGGLASGVSGSQNGARPATAPAATPPPTGAASGAGNDAAAQLLALVQNPAVIQALLSLVLGGAGRESIDVGPRRTPVSPGAVLNLISSLAQQAAEQSSLPPAAHQQLRHRHRHRGGERDDLYGRSGGLSSPLQSVDERHGLGQAWASNPCCCLEAGRVPNLASAEADPLASRRVS